MSYFQFITEEQFILLPYNRPNQKESMYTNLFQSDCNRHMFLQSLKEQLIKKILEKIKGIFWSTLSSLKQAQILEILNVKIDDNKNIWFLSYILIINMSYWNYILDESLSYKLCLMK